MSAPRFEMLVDWVDGRLDAAQAELVAEAVATGDEKLRSAVQWLREFTAHTKGQRLIDPPERLSLALRQLFRSRHMTVGDDVVVRLVFDSRDELALAGVRSAATDTRHVHLGFVCPIGDLFLHVTRIGPAAVRVRGQFIVADGPGLEVRMTALATDDANGSFGPVEIDELGEFGWDSLPDSLTAVSVVWDEQTFVFEIPTLLP